MNLPNQLTVARLGLTGLFVFLLSEERIPHGKTLALLTFGIAAFTDFLDGYLARKHSLITNFGKLMDPLADKILMASGFVMLVGLGLIEAWMVVAILSREFLVTGLRLLATAQGKVLAAENLGKHKTAWQIITLLYFLAYLASAEPLLSPVAGVLHWPPASPAVAGRLLLLVSLVLTVWSGLSFAWKSRRILGEG
ncbi:MAG: CDP-diacylglycerol--glycerol-3-phosphate 3-phosphatidyltransferase [Verrucomicrobia bacterium]|nr:CDP-diacylglycerol--glycerol-3-phosphate 3-phosphatidyltransferase [Verrucomicrobiota bacterium]